MRLKEVPEKKPPPDGSLKRVIGRDNKKSILMKHILRSSTFALCCSTSKRKNLFRHFYQITEMSSS